MSDQKSQIEKIDKLKDLISGLENSFPEKQSKGSSPEILESDLEDFQALRRRALKYIGADRGKSYAQVERVLTRHFPEISQNNSSLIDQVIVSLIDDAYLDERLCGRRLIKRHSGRKQKSARYLEHLLKQQGISESIIDELKLEIAADEKTAEAYFHLKKDEWDYNQPEKIIRHFSSRGYSSGLTLKIMRKYVDEE
ncbi:MAG: hypothetical protein GX326_07375 [Clostridiaceae bacterium]|nr:hypothetical protein [Clostridiaceae bacterium]